MRTYTRPLSSYYTRNPETLVMGSGNFTAEEETAPTNYKPLLIGGALLLLGGGALWAFLKVKKDKEEEDAAAKEAADAKAASDAAAAAAAKEAADAAKAAADAAAAAAAAAAAEEEKEDEVDLSQFSRGNDYSPFAGLDPNTWKLGTIKGITPPAGRTVEKQVQDAEQRIPVANFALKKDLFDHMDSVLGSLGADLRYTKAEDLTWATKMNGYLIPDASLLPNIVPMTWALGWLTEKLGYTPWVTSGYRSVKYDEEFVPDAEPDSRNHWFAAVDLTLPTDHQNQAEREKFRSLVRDLYSKAGMSLGMGIGMYDTDAQQYTLHLDAGGGPKRPTMWGDWEAYS